MDQEVAHARSGQHLVAAIQRIPFAHASQVELHPGTREANRSLGKVQLQVLTADALQHFLNVFRCGVTTGTRMKSPQSDQRSRGDVERAACRRVPRHTALQQFEQPRFHTASLATGFPIDPADFAVRSVDRQLIFQSIDQVQGLGRGLDRAETLFGP